VRGFEELVLDGAKSPCSFADSRVNVQVITALHEAARTRREVVIASQR